ncbi:hypothetical protein K2V49_08695 [Staphylococcus gallinarum]|uniref:hypothetical protein n=1 Tax=Staphylococcus gallinarum TaxID=1293 RepID=UPI001E3DA73A|nr:hypothetical protein [Staphylococcus gallinarum]MCD8900344.1 hypothetical protein [Staphylococcus gallinarum]MCD8901594.1 hypothetical protein [Staphylococcus gallinarum]MEB6237714.1 hypothetical protein [Staphylococcus gallinarum]
MNIVPNDLYHHNLYKLIKGMMTVLNESSILKQHIIELSWWKDGQVDEVIAPALNISMNALNKGRRAIIKQLVNEIGWI